MATVEYQFTEQEAVSALLKGRHFSRWQLCIYIAVVAVGIALILSSRWESSYRTDSMFTLGYFITFLGIVLTFFTPPLHRASYANHVRKNAAIYTEKYCVAFDEQRLVYETPKTRTEIAWTWYRGVSEDQDYFYLLGDGGQVMSALPKRAFDHGGLTEFRRCSQAIPRT